MSGGCLEGDIARKAWWRTESGPAVVRYDSTGEEPGSESAFGLGCNGVVDVLLERLDPSNPPDGGRFEDEGLTRDVVPGTNLRN